MHCIFPPRITAAEDTCGVRIQNSNTARKTFFILHPGNTTCLRVWSPNPNHPHLSSCYVIPAIDRGRATAEGATVIDERIEDGPLKHTKKANLTCAVTAIMQERGCHYSGQRTPTTYGSYYCCCCSKARPLFQSIIRTIDEPYSGHHSAKTGSHLSLQRTVEINHHHLWLSRSHPPWAGSESVPSVIILFVVQVTNG